MEGFTVVPHERKLGMIERENGNVYYTCAYSVGHRVHAIRDNNEVVLITIVNVTIVQDVETGLSITYVGGDDRKYRESDLHKTYLSAKREIYSRRRG